MTPSSEKIWSKSKLLEYLKNNPSERGLLGVVETEEIDFKSDAYDLSDDEGKFELCKDITSFANANGGVIVIGCYAPSEQTETSMVDKVVSVNGLSSPRHGGTSTWKPGSEQQYEKVLSSLVHPRPTGGFANLLNFQTITLDTKKKLLIIEIEKAERAIAPLVIEGNIQIQVAEKGKKSKYKPGYACYRRTGDRSELLLSGYQLSAAIREFEGGNRNDDVKALALRVQELEGKLQNPTTLAKEKESSSKQKTATEQGKEIATEIDQAITFLSPDSKIFFIGSSPNTEKEVPTSEYWKEGGKVFDALDEPVHIREMGWDQRTAPSERPFLDKGTWTSTNGKRKVFRITRSGVIVAAGSLSSFLSWAVDKDWTEEDVVPINATALAEYVANYIHTLYATATVLDLGTKFRIHAGFINGSGWTPNTRAKHIQLASSLGIFGSNEIGKPVEIGSIQLEIDLEAYSPDKIAGDVLNHLYSVQFGLTADKPFLTDEMEFDFERMRSLK